MHAKSIGHIARNIGSAATIGVSDTVTLASQRMKDANVGCLVVVSEDGELAGVISERDIVTRALGMGLDVDSLPVGSIMTRTVVSCSMASSIARAQELMASNGIRHLPIVEGGRAVGMVSSRDLVSHQALAQRAMEHAARRASELARQFQKLDYLQVLALVTREVPRIFGAESGVMFLQETAGGEFRLCSRTGCQCPDAELARRAPGDGNDPVEFFKPCHWGPTTEEAGHSAVFQFPVYAVPDRGGGQGDGRGWLCMCRFSQEAQDAKALMAYEATLLSEMLGINLMNARLYERARQESRLDGLTGMYTRRVFEERLEHEFDRVLRYKSRFSLAIWDVDRFKSINDHLGHAAGDEALRGLSRLLSGGIRSTDVLARYGGDEFVLLMPETSLPDAVAMAERIRATVADELVIGGRKVTVSCGIAESSGEDDDSIANVLRRADLALYRAKNNGRNRLASGMAMVAS